MTTNRDTQLSALLDQADAAGAHGEQIMASIADQLHGHLSAQAPRGPAAAVLRQFVDRAATGHLTGCGHLSDSPEPLWWVPHRPGKLRCADCCAAAGRAIRGTREDRRCDACRRVRSTIVATAAALSPIVVDLPGLPPVASGPVIVLFGLCPPCRDASEIPTTSTEGTPA